MSPDMLDLEGIACSGAGDGAYFTRIDWVVREFRGKLGFEPYPGTFNLRMSGPAWEKARRRLAREPGIAIEPMPGFCAAKCFAVVIDGRLTGAAVFPEVADYPADKLEVIAPVPVRGALGLDNGDPVRVQVVIQGRPARGGRNGGSRRSRETPAPAPAASGTSEDALDSASHLARPD